MMPGNQGTPELQVIYVVGGLLLAVCVVALGINYFCRTWVRISGRAHRKVENIAFGTFITTAVLGLAVLTLFMYERDGAEYIGCFNVQSSLGDVLNKKPITPEERGRVIGQLRGQGLSVMDLWPEVRRGYSFLATCRYKLREKRLRCVVHSSVHAVRYVTPQPPLKSAVPIDVE